jgi:outer membrane biosynthesis protein TonB
VPSTIRHTHRATGRAVTPVVRVGRGAAGAVLAGGILVGGAAAASAAPVADHAPQGKTPAATGVKTDATVPVAAKAAVSLPGAKKSDKTSKGEDAAQGASLSVQAAPKPEPKPQKTQARTATGQQDASKTSQDQSSEKKATADKAPEDKTTQESSTQEPRRRGTAGTDRPGEHRRIARRGPVRSPWPDRLRLRLPCLESRSVRLLRSDAVRLRPGRDQHPADLRSAGSSRHAHLRVPGAAR